MKIGKKIQQRRKELHMTQEKLAEAVFVTPQAVSLWETGKSTPDLFNIARIASALQMNRKDLLSEEETLPTWVMRDSFYSLENMRRKLKQFAEEEHLAEMDKAIDYASEKHQAQFRKKMIFTDERIPYIVHPFMMACHAHALGIRDDAVLASVLLHDVCEDCGVLPEDLPFSEDVKDTVRRLTKTGLSTEEYYRHIAESPSASIVKALDRCNNLSTMMSSFREEKAFGYIEETERYVIPLIDHIKKEYTQYYDAVFVIKYQILSLMETIKACYLQF